MSNFLAIATVTAALGRALSGAVGADVPGATVTTLRPDDSANGAPDTGVNVYLYQVTPNASWRNADLPTRRADGGLVQRPRAALDLQYLLTFHGNEVQLEPQRLLGSVVRTLHDRPILTRQMIRDTVGDATNAFLADSDLAEEIESVKFAPSTLSLEELSKLWSVFFQVPYTLSVTYQASVVLIEPQATPRSALPVRERNVHVAPFRQPTVDRVSSRAGDREPILAEHDLVFTGRNLRGEVTRVKIAGLESEPLSASDSEIVAPLPDNLRAGPHGAQVVHLARPGTALDPRRIVESNVAAFVLRPTIVAAVKNVEGEGEDPRDADVEVDFAPAVGRPQRVVLLLDEFQPPSGRPARAYAFEVAPGDEPTAPDEVGSIKIRVSGVAPGTYLVRAQVDGAESPLGFDEVEGRFDSPRVTFP